MRQGKRKRGSAEAGDVRPARWTRLRRAGAALLALAAGAIVVNALWLQPALHPAPWLETRNLADTGRAVTAAGAAAPMPRPRPAPPASPVPAANPVVLAVQHALARAAYGPLTPDGRIGRGTQDAIRRFQLDEGLEVTGAIDEALLRRLSAVGALDGG